MTERVGSELEILTIRIPIRLQRRGGRKLIMTPEGAAVPTPKPRRDDALIKALVRAHRCRRRIESGKAKSITDLAEQEGVTDAYVCRLLPLTYLAPDIVEAILDGRQPKGPGSPRCLLRCHPRETNSEQDGVVAASTRAEDRLRRRRLPEGGRDAHPFKLCTRYAGTGRTNPFKVRSPRGSDSMRSSIAASARWLIRISPSAASSQSREARFETGPIAA